MPMAPPEGSSSTSMRSGPAGAVAVVVMPAFSPMRSLSARLRGFHGCAARSAATPFQQIACAGDRMKRAQLCQTHSFRVWIDLGKCIGQMAVPSQHFLHDLCTPAQPARRPR